MDLLSKLGKRIVTPSKKARPAEDQLVVFQKTWVAIQASLTGENEAARPALNVDELARRLQVLSDVLVAENRRSDESVTGPCLEFLFRQDVLGNLVTLALADHVDDVKGEAIRFLVTLVVLLDERFLVHGTVHKPLLRLLRHCIQPDPATGSTLSDGAPYEEALVDLLCHVANRIRAFPELLPIFFYSRSARSSRRSPPALARVKQASAMDSIEQRILGAEDTPSKSRTSNGRPLSPTPSEDESVGSSGTPSLSRATSPGDYEFLIFGYLLRFIHREGRTGDLARSGLLFLIDIAMAAGTQPPPYASTSTLGMDASLALAEYLLDSDFAEVLGAGLGALYGLLPSKLALGANGQGAGRDGGMVLGAMGASSEPFSEAELDRMDAQGIVDASSSEVTDALVLLLKLVTFTQDVLQRAPSSSSASTTAAPMLYRSTSSASSALSSVALVGAALAENVLSAVRSIFLESILYPSVLECSEHDGSAVAVLVYLEALLSTIDGETPFASTVLDYLLTSADHLPLQKASMATLRPTEATPRVSKRKSSALMLVEGVGAKRETTTVFTSLGRYSLRDLLLQHLACASQPTRLAALRLLTTLTLCHRRHADALLEVRTVASTLEATNDTASDDSEVFIYPGAEPSGQRGEEASAVLLRHAAEMADLLDLLVMIDPASSPVSTANLSRYMADAEFMVVRDAFAPRHRSSLRPSSSLLRILLTDLLSSFFANPPDVNLALTGVLAALASDPSHTLNVWLLPSLRDPPVAASTSHHRDRSGTSDDGDDRSIDHIYEDQNRLGLLPASSLVRPRWTSRAEGVVFVHLEALAKQVATAREKVVDFDALLAERRSGLLFVDSLADALNEDVASSATMAPDSPKRTRVAGAGSGSRATADNPFAGHYERTAALPSPFGESGNLSMALDNVVLLEEAVKELVAVVQCRRALGVDPL